MILAELIRLYIDENDLTYEDFAQICGISKGYVSMLVHNRNPKTGKPPIPTIKTYKSIAEALGMTLGELFLQIDDAPVRQDDSSSEKLGDIKLKLANSAKSDGWRILSRGLEQMKMDEFRRVVNLLRAVYPEYFNEQNDDK